MTFPLIAEHENRDLSIGIHRDSEPGGRACGVTVERPVTKLRRAVLLEASIYPEHLRREATSRPSAPVAFLPGEKVLFVGIAAVPAWKYYSSDLYNGLGVGGAGSAGVGGDAIGGRERQGGRRVVLRPTEGTPRHSWLGPRCVRIASVPAKTFI
ncbi:unnamed protein product, partial [Iphiclides podalirius]